jgi:hypothetical protein
MARRNGRDAIWRRTDRLLRLSLAQTSSSLISGRHMTWESHVERPRRVQLLARRDKQRVDCDHTEGRFVGVKVCRCTSCGQCGSARIGNVLPFRHWAEMRMQSTSRLPCRKKPPLNFQIAPRAHAGRQEEAIALSSACRGLPVNESCFRDVLDRREPTRIDLVANPRPLPPNPASDSLACSTRRWRSLAFGTVLGRGHRTGPRYPYARRHAGPRRDPGSCSETLEPAISDRGTVRS